MDLLYHNLKIRNAIPDDAAILAAWWNDGALMAHAGFPNGIGTTETEVAKKIASESDETVRRLMIEYENEPIGEMCYMNRGKHMAEIGIKICCPDYQEKGLGRKALSLLIKELFCMGFEKVVLDTNLNNKRAQHVYELLGFQKVKINMDSWEDQFGNFQSSVDYELIKESFVDYAI